MYGTAKNMPVFLGLLVGRTGGNGHNRTIFLIGMFRNVQFFVLIEASLLMFSE